MTTKFSKREAIKFGWQTMKQNFWFFAGLLIVVALIFIIPNVVSDLLEEENLALSFAADIIGAVLGIIVTLGLIKISLNFCDNIKGEISVLFSQYRLFFIFLFGVILYNLAVLAGLILLVIPGAYLAIRLQFYRYFIVDKRSRITESLKKSWEITRGSFWNLFLFGLLMVLINMAGALVFLIGLFATVPTTLVAVAFVYRKLLGQMAEAAPHSPTSPMTPPPLAPAPVAPPTPPPTPPAQPPMIPPST